MSQKGVAAAKSKGKAAKSAAKSDEKAYTAIMTSGLKPVKAAFLEVVAHFTSAMMQRGTVSRKAALYLLAETCERVCGSAIDAHVSLAAVVEKCNDQLGPFGFAIKKVISEADGHLWFCFVNTQADELAKVTAGKAREDWQLHLFKWFFEEAMDSPPGRGVLSREQVVEEFRRKVSATTTKKITQLELETAIDRLIREGWLMEAGVGLKTEADPSPSDRNNLILGPRALAELKEGIRVARGSPEHRCPICREPVVYGHAVEVQAEDGQFLLLLLRLVASASRFLPVPPRLSLYFDRAFRFRLPLQVPPSSAISTTAVSARSQWTRTAMSRASVVKRRSWACR